MQVLVQAFVGTCLHTPRAFQSAPNSTTDTHVKQRAFQTAHPGSVLMQMTVACCAMQCQRVHPGGNNSRMQGTPAEPPSCYWQQATSPKTATSPPQPQTSNMHLLDFSSRIKPMLQNNRSKPPCPVCAEIVHMFPPRPEITRPQ